MGRQVYGKYELISRIASGGMAEVWLARSSSIGGFEKQVAIKRLHPRFGGQPALVSLFIEEAKLSVLLNHPNIVQIFDFGEVDGDYFIAMEYVDGLDVATLAKSARGRGVQLPVGVAAFIVRQVLEGLAHAHGNKKGRVSVIHRDVSPHNVLISFDGQVKLSDFGIAKAIGVMARTEGGQVMGKSAYMSPEQARGEALTPATDIWSAGVMLHELLTGDRLFVRGSDDQTLAAVEKDAVPPPSSINTYVPPALDALVLSLLERDPTRRPESARKAAEALSAILREHYPTVDDYRLAEVVAELGRESFPPVTETHIPVYRPSTPSSDDRRTKVVNDEMIIAFEHTSPSRMPPPPEAIELKKVFIQTPNLWVLYDIGIAFENAGQKERALGAYKVAMAKFAQVGLLVQAVSIAAKILGITGPTPRTVSEIARLPRLHTLSDADLLAEVMDPSDETASFSEYEGLFRTRDTTKSQIPDAQIFSPAPIFSVLQGPRLVRLVMALRRKEYPAGAKIISEGETERSFYFIGRGRVVVSTTNYEGRRVYLTSLADGDCFGEQAFFSGEPRNANVEAMEPVIALEVARDALSEVVGVHSEIEDELKAFYKERIAESLLARSSLFGHLAVRERKRLAAYFGYVQAKAGEIILREGDRSDAFYALRHGKVAVFSGGADGATAVELAVLGPGEVFGEVAAVKGAPRTASVRALADCELLRIEASDLQQFLTENPEVRQLIERQIETRAEDTIQRLVPS